VIDHGRSDSYEHEFVGYNYRMTNIQAVIGRDQLQRLPGWLDRRRENAKQLTARLADVTDIETPTRVDRRDHAFHQYTIVTDHRDTLQSSLDANDVGYGVYYPMTIPDQPAYDRDSSVPVARQLAETVLSLPVHPYVTDEDIETVVNAVEAGMEVSQ
jgi:dTDP-4-amino-4,6-dideoxygalactose transaminase